LCAYILIAFLSDEIDADLVRPDNNQDLLIFPLLNEEHEGRLFNGYEAKTFGNIRDVLNKSYQAHIVNKNQVLFQFPSAPFAFVKNGEVFDETANFFEMFNAGRSHQYNVLRNKLKASSLGRNKKFLLVHFPSTEQLSNRFSNSKDKYSIKMNWIPVPDSFMYKGKQFDETYADISWTITIEEDDD
jgi:hypothetical protein